MLLTNLEKHPEFREKTLHLIESSFGYDKKNSFAVDFYPLFNKNNFKNCHILIEDQQVLAHIGILKRNITVNNNHYSISMYGGIAVSETARGKGYFKNLMNYVLENNKNSTFHLLWSDKLELYKKFNFHPCGELFVYKEIKEDKKETLHSISMDQLDIKSIEKLNHIYHQNHQELRIQRSIDHWLELSRISSADIYLIYQDKEIINYFIKNKGQDLTNIIHEYGYIDESVLDLLNNNGEVWTSFKSKRAHESIYMTNLRMGNDDLFKQFIQDYTKIQIQKIEPSSIHFKFNQEQFEFEISDFLLGIFGPGRFEELNLPPLYICGLDSI